MLNQLPEITGRFDKTRSGGCIRGVGFDSRTGSTRDDACIDGVEDGGGCEEVEAGGDWQDAESSEAQKLASKKQ